MDWHDPKTCPLMDIRRAARMIQQAEPQPRWVLLSRFQVAEVRSRWGIDLADAEQRASVERENGVLIRLES